MQAANDGTGAASAVVHNTGCGCSKSACLKRYCECFNGGIACSDKCRCKDCKNTGVAAGALPVNSGVNGGSGGEAAVALLAIAAAATAAAAAAATTATGVGAGGSQMGQCAAPVSAEASAVSASRSRKGELSLAAGSMGDGDLHTKVEVGGGAAAATAARQASGVVRSPLGMLPGIVIGDDSSSNRGTTRV